MGEANQRDIWLFISQTRNFLLTDISVKLIMDFFVREIMCVTGAIMEPQTTLNMVE